MFSRSIPLASKRSLKNFWLKMKATPEISSIWPSASVRLQYKKHKVIRERLGQLNFFYVCIDNKYSKALSCAIFGSWKKPFISKTVHHEFGKYPPKFTQNPRKIHVNLCKSAYLRGFWSKSAFLKYLWTQFKTTYLQGLRS